MQPSPQPHVIRLRDPWERQSATSPEDRSHQPISLFGFVRRFGLPTGLQSVDRVDLVVDGASEAGCVWLNGVMLGEIIENQPLQRFPVRDLLQNRNLLTIEFTSPDPAPSIYDFIAEIRLEIFEA